MNGVFFDLKYGLAVYLKRWYDGLIADTPAIAEYSQRGAARSIFLAPDRMVDGVEDMIAAYRKNNNEGAPGANSLFPVVMVAVGGDIMPTGGDWGAKQTHRELVFLVDGPGASAYGYRQAMLDVRAQIVICAADVNSARSLATQMLIHVGQPKNRSFRYTHRWHGYDLDMPVVVENTDLLFQRMPSDHPNVTILAADLTLKATIPYIDAPKPGEDNDGKPNVPPGYPIVEQVNSINLTARVRAETSEAGTEFVEFSL